MSRKPSHTPPPDPVRDQPYWESKSLTEMSEKEWEDLCDGCGKCCLIKLQDDETDKVYATDVHCKLFDNGVCRCSDYSNRTLHVPDCVVLKPQTVSALKWMPRTCAYRLLSEGKALPEWHHLISGSRDTIHKVGMSVQNATISEEGVEDDDLFSRVTVWPGEPEWDQG